MEEGCEAELEHAAVPPSTKVEPAIDTMTGDFRVWGLKDQKRVVVPDGVEKVGDCWFCRYGVESLVVPDSVRELRAHAFDGCERLGEVVFASGNCLELVENKAFWETGVRSLEISGTVDVAADAFEAGFGSG